MDSDFLRLARRVKALESSNGTAAGARMAGEILLWPGAEAPEGWLLCDGAEVSRTEYAALFAVVDTVYGSGDGSTTFNLPNLKGRMAAGLNGSDAAFDALGMAGGEKAHTLAAGEMPGHTHTQNAHTHGNGTLSLVSVGAHEHSLWWGTDRPVSISGNDQDGGTYSSSGYRTGYSSGSVYEYATRAKAAGTHTHALSGAMAAATASMQSAGGGGAHNNLPPYVVLNYIIKA